MGLLAAQATVTTAPAKLCTIPPGPCTLVLSNSSASNAVYVGTGTVSTSNGTPVPAGKSVTLDFAEGGASAILQAVGAATAVVGVLISQAGPFAAPPVLVPGPGTPGSASVPGLAVPGEMTPGSPG